VKKLQLSLAALFIFISLFGCWTSTEQPRPVVQNISTEVVKNRFSWLSLESNQAAVVQIYWYILVNGISQGPVYMEIGLVVGPHTIITHKLLDLPTPFVLDKITVQPIQRDWPEMSAEKIAVMPDRITVLKTNDRIPVKPVVFAKTLENDVVKKGYCFGQHNNLFINLKKVIPVSFSVESDSGWCFVNDLEEGDGRLNYRQSGLVFDKQNRLVCFDHGYTNQIQKFLRENKVKFLVK